VPLPGVRQTPTLAGERTGVLLVSPFMVRTSSALRSKTVDSSIFSKLSTGTRTRVVVCATRSLYEELCNPRAAPRCRRSYENPMSL